MKQVKPDEARRGTFLKSFDMGDFGKMLDFCTETEKAMGRNKIGGEIVFTKIAAKRKIADTWQVFVVRK